MDYCCFFFFGFTANMDSNSPSTIHAQHILSNPVSSWDILGPGQLATEACHESRSRPTWDGLAGDGIIPGTPNQKEIWWFPMVSPNIRHLIHLVSFESIVIWGLFTATNHHAICCLGFQVS